MSLRYSDGRASKPLGPMTNGTLSCNNVRRKWESVLLSQIGRGSCPGRPLGPGTARGSSPKPRQPHGGDPTPTSDSSSSSRFISIRSHVACGLLASSGGGAAGCSLTQLCTTSEMSVSLSPISRRQEQGSGDGSSGPLPEPRASLWLIGQPFRTAIVAETTR